MLFSPILGRERAISSVVPKLLAVPTAPGLLRGRRLLLLGLGGRRRLRLRGLLLLLDLNGDGLGSLPVVLRDSLVPLEPLDEAESVVFNELAHGQLVLQALLQQFQLGAEQPPALA